MRQQRSLDELLHHMKALARQVENDWEANFARSTLRHAKRPDWQPSTKQLLIMQRLVSETFVRGGVQENDDLDLINREDRVGAA